MKIQSYIEKLHSSDEFKNFSAENPESFMTAGFFVLDLESKADIHQIDYYIPSKKKVAAFSIEDQITMQLLDLVAEKMPTKLEPNANMDLDNLQGILHDEMRNRGMSETIKKIIAVIQTLEGKKTWILNCVLSGMEILKSHVDDESKTVLKMEKLSMLDLIKTVPNPNLKKNPQQNQKPDLKKELEKLKKVEEQIKDQESKIEEELDKGKKN